MAKNKKAKRSRKDTARAIVRRVSMAMCPTIRFHEERYITQAVESGKFDIRYTKRFVEEILQQDIDGKALDCKTKKDGTYRKSSISRRRKQLSGILFVVRYELRKDGRLKWIDIEEPDGVEIPRIHFTAQRGILDVLTFQK